MPKKPKVVIVRFWSSEGEGHRELYVAIRVVDGVRGFQVIEGEPDPEFLEELRTFPYLTEGGGRITSRAGIPWAQLLPVHFGSPYLWAETEEDGVIM